MNDLVPSGGGILAPAQPVSPAPSRTTDPVSILELAVRQGADITTIKELSSLAAQWEDRAAKRAHAEALAACQAEIPTIPRRSTAGGMTKSGAKFNYEFADLATIMEFAREPLARHGLSVTTDSEIVDDGGTKFCVARCIVRHSAGHHEVMGSARVPVDMSAHMNLSQKYGAVKSYARRYALKDALNIVEAGEDHDAADDLPPIEKGPPVRRRRAPSQAATKAAGVSSETFEESLAKLNAAEHLMGLQATWSELPAADKGRLKAEMRARRDQLLIEEVDALTAAIKDSEDLDEIRGMVAKAHQLVATRVQGVMKNRVEELSNEQPPY